MTRYLAIAREARAGFCLAVLLGIVAYYSSELNHGIDPLVTGIVLGMLVRLGIGKMAIFEQGLAAAPRLLLPVGFVLYGVQLKLNELDIIPLTTWMQVIIGVVVVFAVAIWLGRRLEIEPVTTLLVGVGTAICGAAAIALCAPLLKSKPKETSIALLTITCWSIAGIVLYPHLHAILAMTQENYALLCATTLHQTGAVTLAASSMGPSCAHTAMIIKGARTCIIIPVLCILACRNYLGEHKKPVSKLLIPWYVWAFLFAGAAFSFLPPLRPYVSCVMPATKLLWTMAMTALGLTVHLREITCDMRKPLLLGLVVWSAVIGNYFVGYYGMGY